MGTIREEAMAYESKATKNVSELSEVSVDAVISDDSFEVEDDKGGKKTVEQKIIEINEEKYRIPASVLKNLKAILEDNPSLKRFKVKKTGTGFNTEYTVIPLF